MLTTIIVDIIGVAPPGWEFIPYLLAAGTYLVFFAIIAKVFTAFFPRFRGLF